MARTKRWESQSWGDGFGVYKLSSWKYFHDFIRQEMMDFSHYVWRGQRDSIWTLRTSFDRKLQFATQTHREAIAARHLQKFMYASRGRRGTSSRELSENEWWALGQHHGLATPLLDWTESPFVALYFAFEKAQRPTSGFRAIWALGSVDAANKRILDTHEGQERAPVVEFVRPLQDDNARLVNQNGLFTRAPIGVNLDTWVPSNHSGNRGATLLKLLIPNSDRGDCLRTLHNMNINHVTLFPDLFGASAACNMALEISGL